MEIENDAGGIRELLLDVRSGHLVAGDDSGVIRVWTLHRTAGRQNVETSSLLSFE